MKQKDIEKQIKRILAHKSFSTAPRASKLLTYLVNAALTGKSDTLKGYIIGVDVFDKADDFDPQLDSIVRVQAGRLRKNLELYYLTDGQSDPIYIELASGSYTPTFSKKTTIVIEMATTSSLPKVAAQEVGDDPKVAEAVVSVPKVAVENTQKIKSLSKATLIVSALTFLVVILTSVFMILPNQSSKIRAFKYNSAMPNGPSIAIFSFDAISLDAENGDSGPAELLKVGLRHEFVETLSRFKDLRVVSYSFLPSDSTASTPPIDYPQTDFHLNGSVQTTADRVQVTSTLTRADTNVVIWSKTYNENLSSASGVLKIQSEIAADVAQSLGQPYSVLNANMQNINRNNRNMEHHFCLMEFYKYLEGKTEIEHKKVRDCLEKATTENVDFSSAWAALSWMYGDEIRNNYNPRPNGSKPFEDAIKAANMAIKADPHNATGHQYLSVAEFAVGNFTEFRQAAETALRLNPNDPEILADVGSHLIVLDDSEQAKQMVEKAIALNPQHPPWYNGSILFYFYNREQTDQALYHARKYCVDNSVPAFAMHAAILVQAGQIDEARKIYSKLIEFYPDFEKNYETEIDSWQVSSALKDRIINDLEIAGISRAVN